MTIPNRRISTKPTPARRAPAARRAAAVAALVALAVPLSAARVAHAADAKAVDLRTAAEYSVLAAAAVTNTGNSTLAASLGVSPGSSITGFPPGLVVAPGTTHATDAPAGAAQADLTAAYVDAAARSVDATTTADLANLILGPGVYSGPSKSALGLSGPLVLDAGGDNDAVFIFQTNSELVTGSSSTVTLINGAQECNVFWQVGSSATLGTSSVFAGTIMAQASITVNNSVTVHGRALARTAAVTLDNDTFTIPTCATTTGTPTTNAPTTGAGTPTTEDSTPTTQNPADGSGGAGGAGADGSGGTGADGSGGAGGAGADGSTLSPSDEATPVSSAGSGGSTPASVVFDVTELSLPSTGLGQDAGRIGVGAVICFMLGIATIRLARRPIARR